MNRLSRVVDGIASSLFNFMQVFVIIMCLIITLDVVLRYLFASQTKWGFEIAGYLLVATAVLPAAQVYRLRGHVQVTGLIDRLPPKVRQAIGILNSLLLLVYATIVTWRGILMTADSLAAGDRATTPMGTPLFLIEALIPLGFGVFGLAVLFELWRRIVSPESSLAEKSAH